MMCFACIMAYGFGWQRLFNGDMEPKMRAGFGYSKTTT
jgi:hypothetical protein